MQGLGQRLRRVHHGLAVSGAVFAPVQQRQCQRSGFGGVEVGRQPRVGDRVQPLGDGRIAGHDQAACRAPQALVGAHGHQMRPFVQRIGPLARSDHAALVGRVKQHFRAHLVGQGAHLTHRVRVEVQTATQRDHARLDRPHQLPQRHHVDRVAIGQHRRGMRLQPIQAGATVFVVGHVPANRSRWRHDGVARLGQRHEGIEVGQGARAHAHLGITRIKQLGGQLGGQHLDGFDRFQPRFVLVARVAQGRPGTQAAGQHRLCLGIHHVGGRVEVETLTFVDVAVLVDQRMELAVQVVAAGFVHRSGELLHVGFASGRDPGAGLQMGHGGIPEWLMKPPS